MRVNAELGFIRRGLFYFALLNWYVDFAIIQVICQALSYSENPYVSHLAPEELAHCFCGSLREKCVRAQRITYKNPESSHCWILSCLASSTNEKKQTIRSKHKLLKRLYFIIQPPPRSSLFFTCVVTCFYKHIHFFPQGKTSCFP